MKFLTSAFIIFIFAWSPVFSQASDSITPQQAVEAERAGNYQKALEIYTKLAERGDAKSMINIGVLYYSGNGVVQNYEKAMDWWWRAFKESDGDAPGNIGVLYRDGNGVKQNKKIAYLLFLFTHMEGLGTQDTQYRVNSILRRIMSEMSPQEIEEALCYTFEYVLKYLETRGNLQEIPKDVLPTSGKIRIKDNNWWLDSEKESMKFSCKPPWN